MQEKLEKEPYFQSIYFFVKGTPLLMLTPQSCMECFREPLLIEQEGLHNGMKINMKEHNTNILSRFEQFYGVTSVKCELANLVVYSSF